MDLDLVLEFRFLLDGEILFTEATDTFTVPPFTAEVWRGLANSQAAWCLEVQFYGCAQYPELQPELLRISTNPQELRCPQRVGVLGHFLQGLH